MSYGMRLVTPAVIALFVLQARADEPADALPDHAQLKTEIVGITPTRLIPTVSVVPPGVAFGWLNYSNGDARVTFEDARIAEKLRCTSPGLFRVAPENVAAPRVPSGSFATLCSLAPGEYDYRVEFTGKPRPLLGKIVVRDLDR